jgi:Mrp family chromosome partitioning ATPase
VAIAAAPTVSLPEPTYFRLQEADVLRTLTGIFPLSGGPDIVRLGWPTLQDDAVSSRFSQGSLRMTGLVGAACGTAPVIGVVGLDCDEDRTIIAINVALAAARAGKRVLVIDADRVYRAISTRLETRVARHAPLHADGRSIIGSAEVMSGIALQRNEISSVESSVLRALEAARLGGAYDLILLDGPALPVAQADRRMLDVADGLLAVIPEHLPAQQHLQKTASMLGGAEQKLAGVVFSELAARPLAQPAMRQIA